MAEHSSVVPREQAAVAIKGKVLILEKWLLAGIPWRLANDGSSVRDDNGELLLDYFPKNISQFCEWQSCQCTGLTEEEAPSVIRTNRSTLYLSNMDELEKIAKIFPKLIAKGVAQLKAANKALAVKGLQHEVNYYKKLCAVQENDITAGALELDRIQSELSKAHRALKNLNERYCEETRQLNERNAELAATLNKVAPLRKGGK